MLGTRGTKLTKNIKKKYIYSIKTVITVAHLR